MLFRMKNSGATLERGLKMLISDLENVDSYIDDLIVYTEDWNTHIRVLDELMNRLLTASKFDRSSDQVRVRGQIS